MTSSNKAPSAEDIAIIAKAAGVPIAADIAARIASSIGPAFDGFAQIAGTLPFDLEPATFIAVQDSVRK